jgi:hypothetical protein
MIPGPFVRTDLKLLAEAEVVKDKYIAPGVLEVLIAQPTSDGERTEMQRWSSD